MIHIYIFYVVYCGHTWGHTVGMKATITVSATRTVLWVGSMGVLTTLGLNSKWWSNKVRIQRVDLSKIIVKNELSLKARILICPRHVPVHLWSWVLESGRRRFKQLKLDIFAEFILWHRLMSFGIWTMLYSIWHGNTLVYPQ